MILNKSVEEATVVCLMLAVQEGHVPVGSRPLSTAMGVSDSYLKKTLRKLVVAGLVDSAPGKAGGFTLARHAEDITLGNVFRAMEGDAFRFKGSSTAERVFNDCTNLPRAEQRLSGFLEEAGAAFLAELDRHSITELLRDGCWQEGTRNWPTIVHSVLP